MKLLVETVLGLFVFLHVCQALQHGKVLITSSGGMTCKTQVFKNQFNGNETVHVYLSLSHDNNTDNLVHDPKSLWVDSVTNTGFSFCVLETAPFDEGVFVVNWLAATLNENSGNLNGVASFQSWTAGTICKQISFDALSSKPLVFLSVKHSKLKQQSDSMFVWAEDVKKNGFKVCLKEAQLFSGVHNNIKVEWYAGVNFEVFSGSRTFSNEGPPAQEDNYAYCMTIPFTKAYYSEPVMLVTANHPIDSANTGTSLAAWIEFITLTNFKLCVKDEILLSSTHASINVDFIAFGDLDPCIGVECDYFAVCKAFGPDDARCVCTEDCPSYEEPVCSTGGKTFDNKCLLELEMCQNNNTQIQLHPGNCEGFPYLRGRAELSTKPNYSETQCSFIPFRQNVFYPDKSIHVQVSVNHVKTQDQTYVHDAAASWVEKITQKGFVACVTLTGRNDRPQHRFATVDWLAYQGAPRYGVAGEKAITENWWTGTTCETIILPKHKFLKAPIVLVTAEHHFDGLKHDAASVWVEDVSAEKFKMCFRELQNFDGIHKSINLFWLAFVDLHRPLFKEEGIVDFGTSDPPKAQDNYAYCQVVNLTRNYTAKPSVLLTARHKTGNNNIPPEHNGISAWSEFITKTEFRICVKELYVNKYDPLSVGYVVMEDVCPDGWIYFEGYCYKTSDNCETWQNASSACRQDGSELTRVDNQEENVFIQLQHHGQKAWIGLNNVPTYGNYNWSDGSPVNFTYWADGQPINGGKDYCAHTLGSNSDWRWEEISCSQCRRFTCRKDFDECSTDNTHCDVDAVCTNEQGSYKCTCKSGYYGNGEHCVKNRGFELSVIIGGSVSYLRDLNKIVDPVTARDSSWGVCYRASRDGWNSATFHSKCNKKGPTIAIIKSSINGYVFGGYTDRSYASTGTYRKSVKSFLFSLKNKDGIAPFKVPVYRYHQNAIFDNNGYGVTFGGGHDIHIANGAGTSTNSYTNLGHTYRPPSGYSYSASNTKALLAGSYNFKPSDVEVFYAIRGPGGLERSEIIGNNPTFLAEVNSWMYDATSRSAIWERCYWAKQDGFGSRYDFHSQCDGLGQSITLIRTDRGYIFGGFTPLSWSSSGGYQTDSAMKSFLFSLYNHKGTSPMKLPIYRYPQYSIYTHHSYGPTFGGGHDMYIINGASTSTSSYSNLGQAYSTPSGMSYGSTEAKSFLAGSYNFKVSDIEVFFVRT